MDDILYGLGAIPSPPDDRDAAFNLATLALPIKPALPVSLPNLPAVWNQGQTGTCVGHGVGLAIAIAFYKKLGYWIANNPVDGEVLSRDLYLQATGDKTLQLGADSRTAQKCATAVGVLGRTNKGIQQRFRIASYHSILPSADVEGAIESALAGGMAVIAGLRWPQNWMLRTVPFDTLPAPSAASAGGHCVAFWRAALKHPAAGSSALRVDDCMRNSWGLLFGPGGNAYVDHAVVQARSFDLWTLQV